MFPCAPQDELNSQLVAVLQQMYEKSQQLQKLEKDKEEKVPFCAPFPVVAWCLAVSPPLAFVRVRCYLRRGVGCCRC